MNTHLTAPTAMPQTNALSATCSTWQPALSFLAAALRQHTAMAHSGGSHLWLDRLCADYHGGSWGFYTLSNGGAFMAPEGDERWSLFNGMNGNGVEMSAEAAGIIACLMAYNLLNAAGYHINETSWANLPAYRCSARFRHIQRVIPPLVS